MATTLSIVCVLMVDLFLLTTAHLQEKLPRSTTITLARERTLILCLYSPYQSLMNGGGGSCTVVMNQRKQKGCAVLHVYVYMYLLSLLESSYCGLIFLPGQFQWASNACTSHATIAHPWQYHTTSEKC